MAEASRLGLLTGGGYYVVTGHAGSLYATATARLLTLGATGNRC